MKSSWLFGLSLLPLVLHSQPSDATHFTDSVEPILIQYCYDCHGDGMEKGKVQLDTFESHDARLAAIPLWNRVLKNTRAHLMPPADKPQPTEQEHQRLESWIKSSVFAIDPENPDPGQVTVRRLNRIEYRNTIRDLMGVDFKVFEEFPPDDTGYGFDNIGDVLTLSPLHLEKYLEAAQTIVNEAVPTVTFQPEQIRFGSSQLVDTDGNGASRLSLYQATRKSIRFTLPTQGTYRVAFRLEIRGDFNFDPGRAEVILRWNNEEVHHEAYKWYDRKVFPVQFERLLTPGEYEVSLEIIPLLPLEEKKTFVDLTWSSLVIEGPIERDHWKHPPYYERFFSENAPPLESEDQRQYAREILEKFALKAFRQRPSKDWVNRLTSLAMESASDPEKTFEQGIGDAMVAILASPRFLFRIESPLAASNPESHPLLDEFALASRLSYFLWSTMPDEELFDLAQSNTLRTHFRCQVDRMLKDPKSSEFVQNFIGQWIQARDIETVPINETEVIARENTAERERLKKRTRFFELRFKPEKDLTPDESEELNALMEIRRQLFGGTSVSLDGSLRRAMRQETEGLFQHIIRENRSVLDLLDSDYTFLNETLAKHYGIPDVSGDAMRLVQLPPESPRGGLLTQGTLLAVTSNPTRTSPVKRGLFILDNILGVPPPPPPANVPDLEEAEKSIQGHEPTLREALELHRSSPLCQSCHQRMDPLGLALENFNALGMWRDQERDQPIDSTGHLITGEPFQNIRELKKILATERRLDFYRCLTEKLLTYALGRGLEYYDVNAVDRIVEKLDQNQGRFSVLLDGIVHSTPFQKQRALPPQNTQTAANP